MLNPVQILMQTVKNKTEELLRIVLVCPGELRRVSSDGFLPSVLRMEVDVLGR